MGFKSDHQIIIDFIAAIDCDEGLSVRLALESAAISAMRKSIDTSNGLVERRAEPRNDNVVLLSGAVKLRACALN